MSPASLPNVELRLDMKTAKLKPINIHLLFSPDDPDHGYQIDRILGKLKFTLDDRDYACSRSELIALGRACDPSKRMTMAPIVRGRPVQSLVF